VQQRLQPSISFFQGSLPVPPEKTNRKTAVLLLIVGSAARIEASPIDVSVLELSVRERIRQIEAQALHRLRQRIVSLREYFGS